MSGRRNSLINMTADERADVFLRDLRYKAQEFDSIAEGSRTVPEAVAAKDKAEIYRNLVREFTETYWPER